MTREWFKQSAPKVGKQVPTASPRRANDRDGGVLAHHGHGSHHALVSLPLAEREQPLLGFGIDPEQWRCP